MLCTFKEVLSKYCYISAVLCSWYLHNWHLCEDLKFPEICMRPRKLIKFSLMLKNTMTGGSLLLIMTFS